ncbi:N-acetylmuramic acid 6-phosphate etherase [Agaribacter flavus]|uniref:N-acetylmuramic acid 6-phosphate etherase n=1 Tax=Agaribacter flavus TaxID=1902781 RepID=A0ABV7FVW8_9ALTE
MDNKQLINELETLVSEGRNPDTMDLDSLSTASLLQCINREDKKVPLAVEAALPEIEKAVELVVDAISSGGRLIYIGAGTSGRLGVLDAVECRPTFSVPDDLVVGLIAGGEQALIHAIEGAEDNEQAGVRDLQSIHLTKNDVVVGIAASGRTPYVIGGLNYANSLSCPTVCVVCNPNAPLLDIARVGICAEVGPECLSGSTRMKSGTAQKLILNMISTASMVKLGKVYQNLMVDLNATNKKLVARAIRIVMQATQCNHSTAEKALVAADNQAKAAILMILANCNFEDAKRLLSANTGRLNEALNSQIQPPTAQGNHKG